MRRSWGGEEELVGTPFNEKERAIQERDVGARKASRGGKGSGDEVYFFPLYAAMSFS